MQYQPDCGHRPDYWLEMQYYQESLYHCKFEGYSASRAISVSQAQKHTHKPGGYITSTTSETYPQAWGVHYQHPIRNIPTSLGVALPTPHQKHTHKPGGGITNTPPETLHKPGGGILQSVCKLYAVCCKVYARCMQVVCSLLQSVCKVYALHLH